jgi:hypothetical protein
MMNGDRLYAFIHYTAVDERLKCEKYQNIVICALKYLVDVVVINMCILDVR